jgi:hypothetical protein
MCIAIVQTKNKTMSKRNLENCWHNNDDGAGILWAYDGKLYCEKELGKFDRFYKMYSQIVKFYGDVPILLHFRTATHGDISLKNTHPFFVSRQLAFIHNGIFWGMEHETKSDTFLFKELLQGLPPNFLEDKNLSKLLRLAVSGNKVVFLSSSGRYTIMGNGHWKDGIWYSNTDYEQKKYTYAAAGWDYSTKKDSKTDLTGFSYSGNYSAGYDSLITERHYYSEDYLDHIDHSKFAEEVKKEVKTVEVDHPKENEAVTILRGMGEMTGWFKR